MEGDIKNVLAKATSVTITYDNTKTNKIEFYLPSNEIPSNVLKIMRALRQYKKLENTCFNRIDTNQRPLERWNEKIVFQLNGKYMQNLNSEWERAIAGDFEKNHLFHPFESVIINRVRKTENGNKDNIDLEYEIKVGLDRWDKQIQEIYLESKLRNNRKCVIFNIDDSIGILGKIDNECKRLNLLIGKYDNFDINVYLKQIGKYDGQIKNGKNELDVISANIENKEIRIQERHKINEIKIKNFEINVENAKNFFNEQKKKEKDELNIIDKCKEIDRIGMELKNLILQIDNDKIITEKEWCIFNDIIVDAEWEILKLFISRILCNDIDLLKDIEERMELSSTSNEYEKCFINISHAKRGSTFILSNHCGNNTNNGCKNSLNVCMSSVNSESNMNNNGATNNGDCNGYSVMLSGCLVCVNIQRRNNQRRVHDDCG